MAQTELDDVILMTKKEVDAIGFSVMYLHREMKKAYEGEWGSHSYTKEEYLSNSNIIKYVNEAQVAVRVGSVRVDIAGNIVGKVVPTGPMADQARKAMASKKGIRIIPRVGWEFGQGGLSVRSIKPFIITFDAVFK